MSTTVAPRGKVFAVVRTDIVVGPRILPTLLPGRWADHASAERIARSIDPRLSPAVILVDKIRAQEVQP